MFGFGAASGHAGSICQLQRRLRLSDVGLQHSPAAQMLLEDASTIKVTTLTVPHDASMCRLACDQSSVACGVRLYTLMLHLQVAAEYTSLYPRLTTQLMTQIMD